jgi:ABC-type transport system involved in multi-copper enzyme maturation permease subunit
MISTAVMAKDLRLRMRGWRWAGVVTLYVAILAAVALAFLVQRYNPASGQAPDAGIRLLQSLSLFQLFLLLFVTPASVAGAISGERQQRTWDLMLVARVPAREIVWGKFLAGMAFNLILICASLPIFSLVFLFGGLTLADLVPIFVVFLATVLLLSAASLLVSVLTARLSVSYMISMVVALTLTVGISLLALDLQSPATPGLLTLGSIPFQSVQTLSPLTPLAHLDPLAALLSALPAETGGTLLGPLGTVQHAFGLPWELPLWGAFLLCAVLLSLVLILVTTRLVHHPIRWRALPSLTRRRARGTPVALDGADGQPNGGS